MEDNFLKFFKEFNDENIDKDEIAQKDKIYEKYFEGTEQLKGNFKKYPIKENTRIMLKDNGERGYDEIFLDSKQKTFGGISENISFIFPPDERVYDKRIGFRYYLRNPLEQKEVDIPYFTLLLKKYRKFEILEKNSSIKDSKGLLFINKEINCLEIIMSIIKNRFKNSEQEVDYPFPYSLVELLGFYYGIKEQNKEKMIFLEPYFPSPFIPETKKEDNFIPKGKVFFVEPILYDRHISILLFYYLIENNQIYYRKNILIDFSQFHYKNLLENDPIFNDKMKSSLICFPNYKIQFGPSCSIWFIGALLVLMGNDNINSFNGNYITMKIVDKINEIMNVNEVVLSFDPIKEKFIENLFPFYFI